MEFKIEIHESVYGSRHGWTEENQIAEFWERWLRGKEIIQIVVNMKERRLLNIPEVTYLELPNMG